MLTIYLALLEDERDQQLFIQIYDRHYDKMVVVATKYFPTRPPMVEDAVHNSFLKVIKYFEKAHKIPENEMEYWLVSITKNECISLLRKENRHVPLEDWDAFEQSVADLGLTYQEILQIISSMPETYRSVLELRFLEELEYKEIAKRLRLTESAVTGRISRGRALLIEKLEKAGYAP